MVGAQVTDIMIDSALNKTFSHANDFEKQLRSTLSATFQNVSCGAIRFTSEFWRLSWSFLTFNSPFLDRFGLSEKCTQKYLSPPYPALFWAYNAEPLRWYDIRKCRIESSLDLKTASVSAVTTVFLDLHMLAQEFFCYAQSDVMRDYYFEESAKWGSRSKLWFKISASKKDAF